MGAAEHGERTWNDRVWRVLLKCGAASASSADTGLPFSSVALSTATGLASQAPDALTNLPPALLLAKSACEARVQAQLLSRARVGGSSYASRKSSVCGQSVQRACSSMLDVLPELGIVTTFQDRAQDTARCTRGLPAPHLW